MRTSAEATKAAPWVRLVREPSKAPKRAARAIRSPADVAALISQRAQTELVECFYLIALDRQNHPIATSELTRGILDSSLVHPREVFRLAILLGAASIIIAHNHPSGDVTPSADDRAVTRQLSDAGSLLGVQLADHVILSGHGPELFSFAEAGLL